MSELVVFHGDKGGVGKSFAASVYLDREIAAVRAPSVIESDLRNPDVIRMFKGHLDCEKFDLTAHEGWMDLYDAMSEKPDVDFIVSMPSQIGRMVADEADGLNGALRAMGRQFALVWIVSRLIDSIHLLKLALDDLQGVDRLFVLKNGFFGAEEDRQGARGLFGIRRDAMSEDENRIDGAFHRLLGRTPTQEEKLRLYGVGSGYV